MKKYFIEVTGIALVEVEADSKQEAIDSIAADKDNLHYNIKYIEVFGNWGTRLKRRDTKNG